jgi:hypothetical protein
MCPKTLRRWLGAGLLGLGAAAGCSHSTTCANCGNCPTCSSPMARAAPAAHSAAVAYGRQVTAGPGFPTWLSQPVAAPTFTYSTAPAPQETAGPAEAAPPVNTGPVDGRSPFPRAEAPPPRRSFADVTAAACFGHAPDYSWLRGRVEFSRLSKGWRLRYASVDEDDRFGGSVSLAEGIHLHSLKEGDLVEVHGRLADPGADGASPFYLVSSLARLGTPGGAEQPAHAE